MPRAKKNNNTLLAYSLVFVLGFIIAILLIKVTANLQQPSNERVGQAENKFVLSQLMEANANIVAVSGDETTGVLGKVDIEVNPSGKGRVLIDTNPFVEPDTQFSAETAVKVAGDVTGIDLSGADVIFSFDIPGQVVGGPSAGAAMTIAAVAALEDNNVKLDTAITGTIEPDGSVGPVGGVMEKAQAAADSGVKTFLVPEGQTSFVYYEKQLKEKRVGNFIIQSVNYVPKRLNFIEYAKENLDLDVIEVNNINDAIKMMIE